MGNKTVISAKKVDGIVAYYLVKNTKNKRNTKKFKPCGEGDNICNCKSADECGYIDIYAGIEKLKTNLGGK